MHKIYIGETIRGELRWKAHLSTLRGNYHDTLNFKKTSIKFGEQAFEWSIIKEVEKDNLKHFFWKNCKNDKNSFIKQGKKLYNLSLTIQQLHEIGGQMKKVMIIDGLNMFLRSYINVPSMDKHGAPNGGTYGFMKSLQKICGMFSPDQVIICWDGQGGSQKRKQMNKNYKAGRAPVRFNRRLIDLSPEEADKNKYNQQYRLMEYLNDLPIIQTMIDYIEADDCISYICQHKIYEDWEKLIVSSDKDFFQLNFGKNQAISSDTRQGGRLPYLARRTQNSPQKFRISEKFGWRQI